MTRTLMIVPATIKVDVAEVTQNFVKLIQDEEIPASLFVPIAQHDATTTHKEAIAVDTVLDLMGQGDINALLDKIVARFRLYTEEVNIMVVQGLAFSCNQPYFAQLNVAIAQALDARVIVIAEANHESAQFLAEQVNIMLRPYGKRILGCLINHCVELPASFAVATKLLGCVKTGQDLCSKIDLSWLTTLMHYEYHHSLSPPVFCYQLIEQARSAKKRIVLPESNDLRTIQAAIIATERNLATCILLGSKNEIMQIVADNNIKLSDAIQIIEPKAEVIAPYVEPMVELRKHKGLTAEVAAAQLQDSVVLGTMMLQQGEVDGLVSGAVHTTANTVRPALQLIKTVPSAKLVSSIFFMCLPDQVMVFGDCAINPNPTAEELASIAIQSTDSAKRFGIAPKVAMISYSTMDSGFGPCVDKVKEATHLVRKQRSDIEIDGPLQYDAAIDEVVGKRKAPESSVAGKANVLIFPNLTAGNAVSKAVQRSTGIVSIGPMLQGLRKPVNDLSRGCSVEDIVFTIVLTAVQAI